MTLIKWKKYDCSDDIKKAYNMDQTLFMDDFD
jgi:hypothetical protein